MALLNGILAPNGEFTKTRLYDTPRECMNIAKKELYYRGSEGKECFHELLINGYAIFFYGNLYWNPAAKDTIIYKYDGTPVGIKHYRDEILTPHQTKWLEENKGLMEKGQKEDLWLLRKYQFIIDNTERTELTEEDKAILASTPKRGKGRPKSAVPAVAHKRGRPARPTEPTFEQFSESVEPIRKAMIVLKGELSRKVSETLKPPPKQAKK